MGCFLLIIIDIFSLNTPNIHEMILMILAWFYLPRAFDFWALYAEIKKNECRWTFCCNFASSYLWWIKEEERLEKSQTTNIHLFEAILFYAAKLLNCWPHALVLARTTSTGSTCILLRNIFIIQHAWFRPFPKKGKICLRTMSEMVQR